MVIASIYYIHLTMPINFILKSNQSIESIDSRRPIQVESIDRVEAIWRRIDRQLRLDRFRGFSVATQLHLAAQTRKTWLAHATRAVHVATRGQKHGLHMTSYKKYNSTCLDPHQ